MRDQDLLVALVRTAERSRMIVIVRAGMADREITIEAAATLVHSSPDWRGEGPKRKLKRLVFDPVSKQNKWEKCWANTGRGMIQPGPGWGMRSFGSVGAKA